MEKIKRLPQKRLVVFYYLFFIFAAAFCIYNFNGTAHEADSITHYLFAKHAFEYPLLFFNHWAKPVFVLLSSPFAQLGFDGMKIFNSLLSLINFYLLYHVCIRLKYRNPHLSIPFLLFCPLYFIVTFSGLTEILFACFLLMGLNYTLAGKSVLAAVVISFIPFVRSEGLIILALYALYFILNRNWRAAACLLVGHIVYSLAGLFAFNDTLWVFSHIPYANLGSPYGSGKLFHFVVQLQYVLGIPLFILFWVGVIENVRRMINNSYRKNYKNIELILIFTAFACFFIAHSLFWYLGIFNSMGLKRVLVGVAPLAILICLQGFNYITENLLCNKGLLRVLVRNGMIAYVLIFPLTSNPAAIDWQKDMNLSVSQKTAINVGNLIESTYNNIPRLVYNDYYLSEVLDVDHFDTAERIDLTMNSFQFLKSGDVIVWDNWHSVVDKSVYKNTLDNNPRFKLLKEFKDLDKQRLIHYAVYEVE